MAPPAPPPAPPRREERPHLPLPLSETNPISLPLHPVPQLTGCMQGAISSQRLLRRLSRVLLTAMGPAWQLPAIAGKLPQTKAECRPAVWPSDDLLARRWESGRNLGPARYPCSVLGLGTSEKLQIHSAPSGDTRGGGQNKALEGKESSQLLRVVVRPVSTGCVLLSAGT